MGADAAWQLAPPDLAEPDAFSEAVLSVHEAILNQQLAGDPMLNLCLGLELRALRQVEDWRALLLLTPWMLVRLLFPNRDPGLPIPAGWSATERRDAGYQVLGPNLKFDLLGQHQQAHLNFHPSLGHYLLQPICLDMESYSSAEDVFRSWDEVIQRRDARMAELQRDCPLQKEISRRELFRRLRPAD